jgi:hypothetical protein
MIACALAGPLCRAANETAMAGASTAAESAARSGERVFLMMCPVDSRLRRELERSGGRVSVAAATRNL